MSSSNQTRETFWALKLQVFPFAAAGHGAPEVRRPIDGYEVLIVHMPHRRVETLRGPHRHARSGDRWWFLHKGIWIAHEEGHELSIMHQHVQYCAVEICRYRDFFGQEVGQYGAMVMGVERRQNRLPKRV